MAQDPRVTYPPPAEGPSVDLGWRVPRVSQAVAQQDTNGLTSAGFVQVGERIQITIDGGAGYVLPSDGAAIFWPTQDLLGDPGSPAGEWPLFTAALRLHARPNLGSGVHVVAGFVNAAAIEDSNPRMWLAGGLSAGESEYFTVCTFRQHAAGSGKATNTAVVGHVDYDRAQLTAMLLSNGVRGAAAAPPEGSWNATAYSSNVVMVDPKLLAYFFVAAWSALPLAAPETIELTAGYQILPNPGSLP